MQQLKLLKKIYALSSLILSFTIFNHSLVNLGGLKKRLTDITAEAIVPIINPPRVPANTPASNIKQIASKIPSAYLLRSILNLITKILNAVAKPIIRYAKPSPTRIHLLRLSML